MDHAWALAIIPGLGAIQMFQCLHLVLHFSFGLLFILTDISFSSTCLVLRSTTVQTFLSMCSSSLACDDRIRRRWANLVSSHNSHIFMSVALRVGVCWMRVRNPDLAVNSLPGNIRIWRIFQYSDPPEIYLIYSSLEGLSEFSNSDFSADDVDAFIRLLGCRITV